MKVKNIVRSAAAALDLSGAVKYCDDGDESGSGRTASAVLRDGKGRSRELYADFI